MKAYIQTRGLRRLRDNYRMPHLHTSIKGDDTFFLEKKYAVEWWDANFHKQI